MVDIAWGKGDIRALIRRSKCNHLLKIRCPLADLYLEEDSMNPQLSSNSHWILAGLSLSLLLMLFPPFWYHIPDGAGLRQWHFFLDSQFNQRHGEVDLAMIFLELLIVWIAMGVAWYGNRTLGITEGEG